MAGMSSGFATLIGSKEQVPAVRLLIESLRTYGGDLANNPIWVFDPTRSCRKEDLADDGVELFPLVIPEQTRNYIFAAKVTACAQSETLAAGRVRSLVWMDPECLIVNPPILFELGLDYDAAVRPVHIKNIGLRCDEPVNNYWERIYQLAQSRDSDMQVESFVDQEIIRAYFNSHAFATNPNLGLLKEWAKLFEILVTDEDFQQACCQSQIRRIFLFQALLSALLISRLATNRIRILPETYNYPYNLHGDVPVGRRARTSNELVTLVWEGRSLDPEQVSDIFIEEPLRTWLSSRYLQT